MMAKATALEGTEQGPWAERRTVDKRCVRVAGEPLGAVAAKAEDAERGRKAGAGGRGSGVKAREGERSKAGGE